MQWTIRFCGVTVGVCVDCRDDLFDGRVDVIGADFGAVALVVVLALPFILNG